MPDGVATSSHTTVWEPREQDVKRYLHFDRHLAPEEIAAIANDPDRVASNPFYPLLRFTDEWTKFRGTASVSKNDGR